MAYVVRAIHRDGVTRTVKIEKNTLREAKESAKSLRELGLWVIIIGPMVRLSMRRKKTLEQPKGVNRACDLAQLAKTDTLPSVGGACATNLVSRRSMVGFQHPLDARPADTERLRDNRSAGRALRFHLAPSPPLSTRSGPYRRQRPWPSRCLRVDIGIKVAGLAHKGNGNERRRIKSRLDR
jgi:hypothetical protein